MEHNSTINNLVLLIVFGPLLLFFIKIARLSRQTPGQTTIEPESRWRDSEMWKDPEILTVNLPVDIVCNTVVEGLASFSFANSTWQIINIEEGKPTTISANLPCLDESDPSNTQRLDVGLIVTINDQEPPGKGSTIRMHFIPYEGLDRPLQLISEGTYELLKKALHIKHDAIAIVHTVLSNQLTNTCTVANYQIGSDSAETEPSVVPTEISFTAPGLLPSPAPKPGHGPAIVAVPMPEPLAIRPISASLPLTVPVALLSSVPAPVSILADMNIPASVPVAPLSSVPAPVSIPADMNIPASAPLPPPETGDMQTRLCPACSQSINPSFPFCLYCGKNF
jgi:hypothetical protein